MTGDGFLGGNQYPCDLCPTFRKHLPRAFGIDWIDHYWACGECIDHFLRKLVAVGGKHAARP